MGVRESNREQELPRRLPEPTRENVLQLTQTYSGHMRYLFDRKWFAVVIQNVFSDPLVDIQRSCRRRTQQG